MFSSVFSYILCFIRKQLLGRASSIGAFVKRGEESGYIKISLRGDAAEEKIVIMRKIDTRNKSEWVLNGKRIFGG